MFELTPIISTLAIGLFTGSLLTEGLILVPYWRRMQHQEFIRLHKSLGPSLFRYFAPLTTSAVLLSLMTAVMHQGQNIAWLATAALCVITLAIFFLYFLNANASFKTGDISETELAAELTRWATWHWLRTGLMLAAFTSSVLGHT